jgi:hypothetical protein
MRLTSLRLCILALAAVGLFILAPTPLFAEPATTSFVLAPQAATAPPGAMPVVITEVHGLVQYRDDESQPWHMAIPQARISEGAELRTGPHSSVTCVIPPDQTFTLDRLGTVRVDEAAQHGNKITTDLIMKYGRTRYEIEAAGLEHEAKISSPSSTLAVRGTVVSLYDQPPFKPVAVSFTGRAQFNYLGNTVYVGHKHGSLTRIVAGADGASETGVDDTVVDPADAAVRSQADATLIATEVSRGAVLSYNPFSMIPVISNGTPLTNSQVPSNLPGALDFVLRWTGDAHLDLELAVEKGQPLSILEGTGMKGTELLFPGFGYQNSASGGHIPYDNTGGPKGGEEFAYWSGSFPAGIYGIVAQNVSGATANATLNVYEDGKPLAMFTNNATYTGIVQSAQFTRQVPVGTDFVASVNIPEIPALLTNTPVDPSPNAGIPSVSSAVSTSKLKASEAAAVLAQSVRSRP